MTPRSCSLALAALLALAAFAPVGADDGAPTPGKPAALAATFTKGATWLVAQQQEGGAWADQAGKADVGLTGLAVAALAGAPAELRAPYQTAIDKGCKYLLAGVQTNGAIIDPGKMPPLSNYKTAIAVLALVSADRDRYKDAILKARGFLEGTQFCETFQGAKPDNWIYGGWEYDDHAPPGTKPSPDVSNVSFTMEALAAAGLPKDSEVWKRATRFLERCQNRSESNDQAKALEAKGLAVGNDGGFTYDPERSKAGEAVGPDGKKVLKSYGSMTYAGIKSFIYAGVDKNDPRVQAAYHWIQQNFTLDENPGLRTDTDAKSGRMGWYYYFHTFAKTLDLWGEKELVGADGTKHAWADELVAKLAALQGADGSWKNENAKWWEDFPPLVTCYSLLALDRCAKWTAK